MQTNTNFSREHQKNNIIEALPEAEKQQETELSLEGELSISDYIQEVEPSEKTKQAIYAWTMQQREKTKEKVLLFLLKAFGTSLGGSFVLITVAFFNPSVDKNFVKDVIPLVIAPQATLFGGVFLAYTKTSKKQDEA